MKTQYKNRNSTKTKKAINKAFIELLEEKEISKITVTDICIKADIHRTTFYNHYSDVYSIIEEIENNIIEELKELFKDYHYTDTYLFLDTVFLHFNIYLEKNLKSFKILIKQSESELFLAKLRYIFKSMMLENIEIPENIKITSDFSITISLISGGITTIYKEWLNDELKCDINEISSIISSFIKHGLKR